MKKIIKIQGMMCSHCDVRVKDALCALAHVTDVTADHGTGTACVTANEDIQDNVLKDAIEDLGFEVTDIKNA